MMCRNSLYCLNCSRIRTGNNDIYVTILASRSPFSDNPLVRSSPKMKGESACLIIRMVVSISLPPQKKVCSGITQK